MFAASLKTLQKRTSQLLKGEDSRKEEDGGELGGIGLDPRDVLEQLGLRPEAEAFQSDSHMLVRYEVQNSEDPDKDIAVFVLPTGDSTIRCALVREHFPLPGNFHFRFKAHMPDNAFGGYAWVDLPNDSEPVPFFRGAISMKVLRLPAAGVSRSHETLPGSRLAAPEGGPSNWPGGPLDLDLGGGGTSPPAASPSYSPRTGSSAPESPTQLPSSGQRDLFDAPGLGSGGHGRRPQAAAVRAAPQTPQGLPEDLMEMDLGPSPGPAGASGASGASRTSGGAAPRSGAGAPVSAPAPPPPKVFDREQLRAEREAGVQAQVAETYSRMVQQRDAEESQKAGKVDASNKVRAEMDHWAKTSDGQSFKDIKALLSTLHTVLWANSGWQPVNLAELVSNQAAVKKQYRKAIILCHPDRHQDADAEQQVRADRVFQALNESFKAANGE